MAHLAQEIVSGLGSRGHVVEGLSPSVPVLEGDVDAENMPGT